MNWFQIGEAPTWFWIHALKPYRNAEASGYSLGFWRPIEEADAGVEYPASLRPGHWIWNPYNWHAVGSFVRHMPWDCQAVNVVEESADPDLRVLAFVRPDRRLTFALSNRSFAQHRFQVDTGVPGVTFTGRRYTPENAGRDFEGIPLPLQEGPILSCEVPDLTWEFWTEGSVS